MLLRYYRVHFYVAGVYVGADCWKCRHLAHALRLAEYVKLSFARAACLELKLTFEPSRVTYDVLAPEGETAVNCNLATCIS